MSQGINGIQPTAMTIFHRFTGHTITCIRTVYRQEKERELTELQIKKQNEFWKEICKIGIGNDRKRTIPIEIERDDGTFSFDRTEILEKWKTKFKDMLTTGEHDTSDTEPDFENNNNKGDQHPFNTRITIADVRKAVTNAKNGKAAGTDDMQAEYIYIKKMTVLLCFWQRFLINVLIPLKFEQFGQSEKKTHPIPKSTYKDPRQPLNYRGFTLISVAWKIYCGILNEKSVEWADLNDKLNDEQNGFRRSRNALDHLQVSTLSFQKEKAVNICCFYWFK